jgi:predicted RNase H-like HicB family nuclease
MEYTARINNEEGTHWAEVPELPGVFASGDTLDELLEGTSGGRCALSGGWRARVAVPA